MVRHWPNAFSGKLEADASRRRTRLPATARFASSHASMLLEALLCPAVVRSIGADHFWPDFQQSCLSKNCAKICLTVLSVCIVRTSMVRHPVGKAETHMLQVKLITCWQRRLAVCKTTVTLVLHFCWMQLAKQQQGADATAFGFTSLDPRGCSFILLVTSRDGCAASDALMSLTCPLCVQVAVDRSLSSSVYICNIRG